MKDCLITVIANDLSGMEEPPASIVYIPEGEHEITPLVNGKPKKITVKLHASNGEKVATVFQQALEARNAQTVRPIFDFDHKNSGPASAIPKAFRYEQGRGLIVDVEWTGKGREAITAKDYSYFSPTFLMAKDGTPSGLPNKGPLGALVNDPAFREIERIAAANADTQPQSNMDTALLIKAGLVTAEDAEKENVLEIAANNYGEKSKKLDELEAALADMTKERDKLKGEMDDLKTEAKNAVESKADSAVKAAVEAGRIAPKDEKTQAFWKKSIVNEGEDAIEAMNALPVVDPTKKQTEIKAKDKDEPEVTGLDRVAAALAEEEAAQ